jgi:3-hydroxypropanoate dehydrogenase
MSETNLDPVFSEARTFNGYTEKPVSEAILRELYDHLKWGPTAANSCPARFVFVSSDEAKQRLLDCVNEGNVAKVKSAPVTAIVAADTRFYEEMPKLFPSRDFASVFAGKDDVIADLLARNVPLQGAYMIIAARGIGLDCGPMSGFDTAAINREFFPDARWQANFICTLGYGDKQSLYPRNPRLPFEAACLVA